MHSRVVPLAAAALALTASAAFATEPETIRIEPRPFYGATVTLEEGVRVFRPLPPTRRVIVNPGGATPLNLSFKDVRIVEEHNGPQPAAPQASASASAGSGGAGLFVPRSGHRGGHHHGNSGGHAVGGR